MSGCPACGYRRTHAAFSAGGIAWSRCGSCATLFDPDPAPAEELSRLYEGEEYFVKAEAAGDADTLWGYAEDYLADRSASERKFGAILARLERYVDPGRLLDLGCGPGFLLSIAERRGWTARGADRNRWAVEHARDSLGLDVVHGDLESLSLGDGELDALTMLDLIEHVPESDRLIAEAARVVRPAGALAMLTPDAGSPVSRLLGRRWPEVRRPGEHTVLYSVDGLARLLRRHGWSAVGWHSIGKEASLATLAADVAPAAPALAERIRTRLSGSALGGRVVDFDPRTKFCLYARRVPNGTSPGRHRPARMPRSAARLESVEAAIVDELEGLASARRFCDWMFDQFAAHVNGEVAEVGAGIGTFSARILGRRPTGLLLLEPEPGCASSLEERFAGDERVAVAREGLPAAPSLREGARFELVVCQNVLEHVADDAAALRAMAGALRPGGRLALVVPARSRLFGPLDDAYGHWRRYEEEELRDRVGAAGLEIEELRAINALGMLGWRLKNARSGARIGDGSLRAFEALVRGWRPLEERLRPRAGLSLFCLARRGEPEAPPARRAAA